MTIIKVLMLALTAFVVTACGGGGGGSGSGNNNGGNNAVGDFTLAQTTVNFSGEIGGEQPGSISITGTLKNANSTVYLVVDAGSTPLIQSASVDVAGTSGVLTLVPQIPSKLAIGKQAGTVTVRACKNQSCSSEYSGSPKTITVNYEVTAPEYSIAPSVVSFTTTQGVLPAPVTVQMSSSKYVSQYGYTITNTAKSWLLIESRWDGDKGTAVFSVIKDLPVGVYAEKIIFYAHGESLQRVIDVTYTVLAVSANSSSSISTSSSSSSSSLSTSSSFAAQSSLSSSSASACGSEVGDVFVDEICATWQQLSAYEQNYANATINYENTSGNSGNAVSFNIIQSADAGRNKVLDIKYLDSLEYFGAVHIRAPGSPINKIDMSEYAHGKVVFDLKVISHSAQNSALEFSIECTWPCASTPKMIKTDVLNEWKTYEFSVAEMIDRGLDIERVSLGFMLLPTWAKQDGAHFQVDNVRWVKGEAPAVEETVCYANFFDDEWVQDSQGVGVSIVGVNMSYPDQNQTTGVKPWVTANPDWSVMNGTWFYWMSGVMNYSTMELLDPESLSNCSGSGTLTLEIYTPAALVEDGKMTFTLQFLDEDNFVRSLNSDVFSVAGMKPDDWNKVSMPLSTAYENLKYVGILIDATQVSPFLISPPFYIDNIVIRK